MDLEQGAEAEAGLLAPGATPALMQAAAAARRQRQPAAHRRRRPQLDAGSDGRPATALPSDEIRKLLADRKSLMTQRGLRARKQRAQLPPRGFDVVSACLLHASRACPPLLLLCLLLLALWLLCCAAAAHTCVGASVLLIAPALPILLTFYCPALYPSACLPD